jgi:hypothetical protein
MSRIPLNVENLLEQMGSEQTIGSPEHRYGLRRKLLCSSHFGDQCENTSGWTRIFTYTAPLFVGGMMVGVFVLLASISIMNADNGHVVSTNIEIAETFELSSIEVNEFASDPNEAKVGLKLDPLVSLNFALTE